MNIFSVLAVNAPGGLWSILIDWINGGILNFGWTILLLTLLVKIVLSPLDFGVKYTTKKQMLVQQKCAPQIAKLQKKFGNDQKTLQVQQQALYKREGLNMGVGCIVMLVNLILTMVIFFTLYSSLRSVSAYHAIDEYEQIHAEYESSYYQSLIDFSDSDEIVDKESAMEWQTNFDTAKEFVENEENDPESPEFIEHETTYENGLPLAQKATEDASKSAVNKWNSIKSSWLWIENIWVADATTSPFPTYDGLKSLASNGGKYYSEYVTNNINEAEYNAIAGLIQQNSRAQNGYYILAVLAGVLTFLSQWLAELHNKLKSKKANIVAKQASQPGNAMKIMKFIMPVIMVLFVISTGASFGIYILTSNLASMLIGEIVTLIIAKLTKKKQLEVEEMLEKEANRLIKKGKLQE